jgi:5'-nucleotidase
MRRALAAIVMAALVAGACGDDDDAAAPTGGSATEAATEAATTEAATQEPTEAAPTPTTVAPTPTPSPPPLRILVTNDDGVASAGIDAVVEALRTLPDVELTVVAPLENQSGKGDAVSDAPPPASDATTLSGFPAVAVAGTPGDAVTHALDVVFADAPPDLVVSGSNDGQNVGTLANVSGTVGAARIGARRGVPGVAVSQGSLTVAPEFAAGIPFLLDWIAQNRDAVLAFEGELAPVTNINVPSCGTTGTLRGIVEVPLALEFEGEEPFTVDCGSTLEDPDDDGTAISNGFATLTLLPEDFVAGTPIGS